MLELKTLLSFFNPIQYSSTNFFACADVKTIREGVKFIQKVGKLPINVEQLDDKMDKILEYMDKYPHSLSIQRTGCHSISNIAMDLDNAAMLMNKNSETLVLDAIKRFYPQDWRICWLGCSAIWNLARPEEFRKQFNKSTVDLVLDILHFYKDNERVVNTAIGALSNISLDQNLKIYVGQAKYIERLLLVIDTHMKNRSIASTAAGLLANLAVNDSIADILVDSGVISTITNMLKLNSLEPTFQRNTAAALSNVITSILFTRECLKYKIIEHLFDLQENATTMGVVALIMNCFNALDINSERRTTSFHMMAHHGMYNLLNKELLENLCNESFDINFLDENEATLLHYAIQREHRKLISLLILCGSDYKSICRESENNSELSIDERARRTLDMTNFPPNELSISHLVLDSIQKTEFNIFCATRRYNKLISCSFWNLPEDLSKIICTFVLPYDMLIESGDLY